MDRKTTVAIPAREPLRSVRTGLVSEQERVTAAYVLFRASNTAPTVFAINNEIKNLEGALGKITNTREALKNT